jgi:hypothetical protein
MVTGELGAPKVTLMGSHHGFEIAHRGQEPWHYNLLMHMQQKVA